MTFKDAIILCVYSFKRHIDFESHVKMQHIILFDVTHLNNNTGIRKN